MSMYALKMNEKTSQTCAKIETLTLFHLGQCGHPTTLQPLEVQRHLLPFQKPLINVSLEPD